MTGRMGTLVDAVEAARKGAVLVVHRDLPGRHVTGAGGENCWCRPHLVEAHDTRTSEQVVADLHRAEAKL